MTKAFKCTPHKHAALMADAAKIAGHRNDWYKEFQIQDDVTGTWSTCNEPFVFLEYQEYRRVPALFQIGASRVPYPIDEAPATGTDCYYVDFASTDCVNHFLWEDTDHNNMILARNAIHLYYADAVTHARALIALPGGRNER